MACEVVLAEPGDSCPVKDAAAAAPAVFDPRVGEGLHGGILLKFASRERVDRELVEFWSRLPKV